VEVPSEWLIPLAGMSGACFSLLGIAYRMGRPRGVRPAHVVLFVSLMGAIFYLVRCRGLSWAEVPARVWVWGALVGLTQYGVVKLIGRGLSMGPLSPIWCAVMLGFIPTTLYAAAFLGEPLHAFHYAAIGAGVASVVLGSLKERSKRDAPAVASPTWHNMALYGAILLGILLLNSLSNTGMKDLSAIRDGTGRTLMVRYGDLFRLLLYLGLGAAVGVEFLLAGRFGAPLGPAVWLGALAGAGSIAGMLIIGICAAGPAALVYPVNSVVSILATSVVSILFFREKLDGPWIGTVGFAVLTVVLASYPAIARLF